MKKKYIPEATATQVVKATGLKVLKLFRYNLAEKMSLKLSFYFLNDVSAALRNCF